MSTVPNLAPRDDERDEDLACAWIVRQNAWIVRQKTQTDTPEWDSLSWTWERFRYLTEYLPDKAWTVIKLIVSRDPSTEMINNLINEPLEDLLQNFGPEMIDVVEDDIRRLPELQPLLTRYLHELDGRRATWAHSEFRGRVRDGAIGQKLGPREDERDEDFAHAWIAAQQAGRPSGEYNCLFWTHERMSYLTTYLPHEWKMILLIWSTDQSIKTMQNLSAGAIEDLLSTHGTEMIGPVETAARRDPTFARGLGGVWKFNMTDDVWARLNAVCDRRGWDGITEE